MSDAIPAETVARDGDAPIVAISDPGEVGRAEHNRGDRFVVAISNVFAWIFPILMVVIVAQVLLRNFGRIGLGPGNQAWMDDLQWWLYGSAVLIGVGYAVTTNSHVRVDVFYDNFPARKQRRIDVFGLAWLFLPFAIFCWDVTVGYAAQSVAAREGSSSPNGLHGLYLLKTFMNLSFLFIAAATWFAYVRALSKLVRPLWWRKLLYAFPSVALAVNLAVYYAALGIALVVTEATTAREATRGWFFDEIELPLGQEMQITVLVSLVLTVILIAAAYALRDRSEATA
jgi:TRAP-type mannitol/chloroaromatic compound transport system permease small subunit